MFSPALTVLWLLIALKIQPTLPPMAPEGLWELLLPVSQPCPCADSALWCSQHIPTSRPVPSPLSGTPVSLSHPHPCPAFCPPHPLGLSGNITLPQRPSPISLLCFSFSPLSLFPSKKWSCVEIISCLPIFRLSFPAKCTHDEGRNHSWLTHGVLSGLQSVPRRQGHDKDEQDECLAARGPMETN